VWNLLEETCPEEEALVLSENVLEVCEESDVCVFLVWGPLEEVASEETLPLSEEVL